MIMIAVLVVLLNSTSSNALGVAPASVNIIFQPGLEKTISMKVINREGRPLTATVMIDGELFKYIDIDKTLLTFRKGEREKEINIKLRLPNKLEGYGEHRSRVMISEVKNESIEEGTTMSSRIIIYSIIKVFVPYPEKFARVRLVAPRFKKEVESTFGIEVINLGNKTIFAKPVLDIYTPLNEKLESLKGEEKDIEPGEKKVLIIKWKPSRMGIYHARAEVIYNHHSAKAEKIITVGEMDIDIVSIDVKRFTLGGIAKFDILLENKWNQKIERVYAVVDIKDESGKVYVRSETPAVDIDTLSKQILNAYWETYNVKPGKYKMEITLKFAGKEKSMEFDIYVESNKISVLPTGELLKAERVGEHSPGIWRWRLDIRTRRL